MKNSPQELASVSNKLRCDIIRSIYLAGSGHPGGSLSIIDILTYLYYEIMNISPDNPRAIDRDKLVLSKGHAAPALYAILADRGFIDRENLWTLRSLGSCLQGHPNMLSVPGVDMSTGSLGQGFSTAVGFALGDRFNKQDSKTFAILGDGELQEGIIWEAALSAAKHGLDKLVTIVDLNGLQIDGRVDDVKKVEPVADKFKAFGFDIIECDGHDFESIDRAFKEIDYSDKRPTCIVARTHKGKGVSFMEDNPGWHGKAPNEEQARQAIEELGGEF